MIDVNSNSSFRKSSAPGRQRGIILFVAMIILIMLALLGLYVTKSSVLQLKMADNTGMKSKTLEFAEASRSYAEAQIIVRGNQMSAGTVYDCSALGTGYYASPILSLTGCYALVVASFDWDNDSIAVPGDGKKYVVEYLGVDSISEVGDDVQQGLLESNKVAVHVFRIVTQGKEDRGSETILETIYLVRKS